MLQQKSDTVINGAEKFKRFESFINAGSFPCLMAKSALANHNIKYFSAAHMACPVHDKEILGFLYEFIAGYKQSGEGYHSAAVIFDEANDLTEKMFEVFLWQRLQALNNLDAQHYGYDKRVSADPMSPHFSFSLKEEALYVIGLCPASNRKARRFHYPALVFNPHAQFELLRTANKYEKVKQVTRARDVIFSGSINPMLQDFGAMPETFQYSGMQYPQEWKCPLHIKHTTDEHHSTP